jgi:hypothetical protein
VRSSDEFINGCHVHLTIWFNIVRANPMESMTTEVRRGDDLLMSSRARRTAAMMAAATLHQERTRERSASGRNLISASAAFG